MMMSERINAIIQALREFGQLGAPAAEELITEIERLRKDLDLVTDERHDAFNEIERLAGTLTAARTKMDWIRTDISYKAPEQLTLRLMAEYLDMVHAELNQ